MKNEIDFCKVDIGKRIRKYRYLSKLSVKEIQSILHSYGHPISYQGFYKWENGSNIPSITHIIILCDIFNISTSTFLKDNAPRKEDITKNEMEFLSTFRENEDFKRLVILLYKKEIKKYGQNRSKTKNIKTYQ